MAGAQAFVVLASAYAVAGIVTFPGSLPAARVVGALAQGSFALVGFSLVFLVLLFPTGTLPSRRWRAIAVAGLVAAGLVAAGLTVHPGPVGLPAPGGVSLSIPNPLGVDWRFNRARYDTEATVTVFAVQLNDTVDLDSLRGHLATAVDRALEPAHVSVWISGSRGSSGAG